ncbi:Rho GTPase-activating protein 32 [Nymphon striatum]|nr:Rho GTPase-activating protein 32 [Nymphon striatum]
MSSAINEHGIVSDTRHVGHGSQSAMASGVILATSKLDKEMIPYMLNFQGVSAEKCLDLMIENEDGLRTMLMKYLDRFSVLAGNLINCGPVLNWFELDNRGNRLLVPEESAINTPAVGAAYVIKRYFAQATDEISFEVGDMVSVIDMPPPEDSIWWRGKKGFQVGFFPCDCVEIISDKIPKNISIPHKSPTKPVLRKHGKLITFFRSFILTRPSRRKLKQRGILKERVFGCDLGEHLLNSGHDIPIVLTCCTEFIEEFGVVDGIYRLSGVTSNIQKLRVAFDDERIPNLQEEAILQDIHCVASLLKMYFRELPNPLLTYQLYDKFVSAVQANEDVRLMKMRDVVHQLPPPHFRTLSYLIKHLSKVSSEGNNTGMGPKNIAIVWAPNLLRSKELEGGSVAALHVVGVQAVLTEYLIRYADLIFNDKMPTFPGNLPEDFIPNEQDSPKKTRPKSLAISTPTKLLSLEEARSRVLTTSLTGTNNLAEAKFIEVGGGPSNLPTKYHTVIDLPAGKRGSGKLKKSPMGWKSFFTKTRTSSFSQREKPSHKLDHQQLEHQGSFNAAFQQDKPVVETAVEFSQNKRLRTVKSAESIVSSVDFSQSTSEAFDETTSDFFKYSPLVSSHSQFSPEEQPETNIIDSNQENATDLKPNPFSDKSEDLSNLENFSEDKKEILRFDDNFKETEEVKNITIEIGEERITESSTNDNNESVMKNIYHNRKNSMECSDYKSDSSTTSPKTHKLSLKQKFKQAFTSPPSIRRVVNPTDDCLSPFKRNPASFREKIVKTFSPESNRKKQSISDINNVDDSGRISPTAPPRRKQRKKTNIEEDFDSSPELYEGNDDHEMVSDDEEIPLPSPEVVESPDSFCENSVLNETVTVEVHAAQDQQSPHNSSEFEFEKSFLSKSERSLLEEVTSELAQKGSNEHFSVFPTESEGVCHTHSRYSFNDKEHSDDGTDNESKIVLSDDQSFLSVMTKSENLEYLPKICDEKNLNNEISSPFSDHDASDIVNPSKNNYRLNQTTPEEEFSEANETVPNLPNISASDHAELLENLCPVLYDKRKVGERDIIDNSIIGMKNCDSHEDLESAVHGNECEQKEFEDNSDSVFIDANDAADKEKDGSVRNQLSNRDIFDEESVDHDHDNEIKQQLSFVESELEVNDKHNSGSTAICAKSRIHSWNSTNNPENSDYSNNSRERWSYPLPERFSPLDDSKRKFESEIGREIVRDRRMQHERQQIQALNLKNRQSSDLDCLSSLSSSGKAIPFQPHPLKSILPSNGAMSEPVEADDVPSRVIGNLPESGARTGSSSSEKSVEEITSPTSPTRVKLPTSPQKSFIPRMISPMKQPSTGSNTSPQSPTNNGKNSVELRRSHRTYSSNSPKNVRNSDPNGSAIYRQSDFKIKRHSEPEIMTKSFPPKTFYSRKQESKTSVKELLNKFEKQPDCKENLSSQSSNVTSKTPIKRSPSSEKVVLVPVHEKSSASTPKEVIKVPVSNRHSSSEIYRRKPIPRPRTKSVDVVTTSPQILENTEIVISDRIATKSIEPDKTASTMSRPTTLFDTERSSRKKHGPRKMISPSKETSPHDVSSVSDDRCHSKKESPLTSPLSPGERSIELKSLLASVADADDAVARRERINRYKEERRAQLREKMKSELLSSPSEETADQTNKLLRENSGSSPTKPFHKKSPTDVNKNNNSLTSEPTVQESSPTNGEAIENINCDVANVSNKNEKETNEAEAVLEDKEIVIVENIPSNTATTSPTTSNEVKIHKLKTSISEKPQPKGIRERVAMFEKDK